MKSSFQKSFIRNVCGRPTEPAWFCWAVCAIAFAAPPTFAQTDEFHSHLAEPELIGSVWRQDKEYGWELAFFPNNIVEPREVLPGIIAVIGPMDFSVDDGVLEMSGIKPSGKKYKVTCQISVSESVMRLVDCSDRTVTGTYHVPEIGYDA